MLKFRWETEFKKTEIGEIPNEWEVKFLEEIVDVEWGNTKLTKKIYREDGYPVFSATGQDGYADFYEREGDAIIVSAIGANCGKCFYAKGKWTAIKNTLILQREKIPWDSRFFYYYLDDKEKWPELGSGQPFISQGAAMEIKVPYPLPSEQSRIATVLSWFDDLIENKKRQNEIMENTAMAIFKSWFVDFEPFQNDEFVYSEELGREIPKGWEVKAIGDISQIEKGLSYKSDELSEDEKEGEIFITLKIFQRGGGFRPEYKYYIGNRYKREHITYDGDLVIALTDMTSDARVVGAPALVILPPDKTKGILSLDAAKLMIPDHIKDYLYLCLKESQEENATFANGVNVLHLNLALFKKGKYILLPPTHILQRFHELVEPMFKKIILNQKEIMILRKARDALLPKLVFGKIRVVEI